MDKLVVPLLFAVVGLLALLLGSANADSTFGSVASAVGTILVLLAVIGGAQNLIRGRAS